MMPGQKRLSGDLREAALLEVFRGNKMPAQKEIPFRPWQVCPAVGYTDKALCDTRTAWFLNAEAAV
jgi:hypothetical protein